MDEEIYLMCNLYDWYYREAYGLNSVLYFTAYNIKTFSTKFNMVVL